MFKPKRPLVLLLAAVLFSFGGGSLDLGADAFAKTAQHSKKKPKAHRHVSKKRSSISKPKIRAHSGALTNQEALARLSSREFMPVTDPSRRPLELGVTRGKPLGLIETYTAQSPNSRTQRFGMSAPGQI